MGTLSGVGGARAVVAVAWATGSGPGGGWQRGARALGCAGVPAGCAAAPKGKQGACGSDLGHGALQAPAEVWAEDWKGAPAQSSGAGGAEGASQAQEGGGAGKSSGKALALMATLRPMPLPTRQYPRGPPLL